MRACRGAAGEGVSAVGNIAERQARDESRGMSCEFERSIGHVVACSANRVEGRVAE